MKNWVCSRRLFPTVGLHAVQDALFAYAAAVTRPDAGRADALEAAAALADYQAAGCGSAWWKKAA